MKIFTIEEIDKKCDERREKAINAVRKADPDFYPGRRHFDRPRKDSTKQRILNEIVVKENELLYKRCEK